MVELQGYQRYIYRCTPAKVNPLIAHTTTIMKLRHIFRFPGMLAISALIAGMATGVTSYQANHISISRGLKTVWYTWTSKDSPRTNGRSEPATIM